MRFPSITKARIAATVTVVGISVLGFALILQTSSNVLTHLTGLPWG